MVFSTTNLFKSVACPAGASCGLTNCIFSHDLRPQKAGDGQLASPSMARSSEQTTTLRDDRAAEPPSKRRKVTYDSLADKPPSRAEEIRSQLAAARAGSHGDAQLGSRRARAQAAAPATTNGPTQTISSLARPVSPPPTSSSSNAAESLRRATHSRSETATTSTQDAPPAGPASAVKQESLNPRLVPQAPESHSKRTLYVQNLHSNMTRLNRELKTRKSALDGLEPEQLRAFILDERELIALALDEEETTAREQQRVYGNVIRNRIAGYMKMAPGAWLEKIKASLRPPPPSTDSGKPAKVIETGLPMGREHLILPHLVVADQAPLAEHGYVVTPPTEEAIVEAKKAVEMSKNYEMCERCGARFQVIPDRDPETGRLTSNGPCRYHWARKAFPQKQKTDAYTGGKDAYFPCCGQMVGTEGCTEHGDHVFKAGSPARLAAVLPFITTPQGGPGRRVEAVVFDCEMGHTTNGLELIRVTAVSWPEGRELVDVLVRPRGPVIDLNSRFSGVRPEHFANAVPYGQTHSARSNGDMGNQLTRMPVVKDPAAARALLCEHLTPETPLMGHAIDNDLNAIRLCHPTIVDTVLLFPHPRGLPLRYGLKMLSKKYLDRDIQTGGDKGHDSREDAVATGDLVRVKVAEVWKDLKGRGWRIEDDELVNPKEEAGDVGWSVTGKKKRKSAAGSSEQGNGLAALLKREGIGGGSGTV